MGDIDYFAEVWKGDPIADKVLARLAEMEAALAERDRMLRLMTGEYRRAAEIDLIISDEMVLADLRARAEEGSDT